MADQMLFRHPETAPFCPGGRKNPGLPFGRGPATDLIFGRETGSPALFLVFGLASFPSPPL